MQSISLLGVGIQAIASLVVGVRLASLARLEARTALAALIPELPRLRARGGKHAMIDSVLVRGRRRILLEPIA